MCGLRNAMHNAQWAESIYGEVKIVRHWMWMEFLGNKNYNKIEGLWEKGKIVIWETM